MLQSDALTFFTVKVWSAVSASADMGTDDRSVELAGALPAVLPVDGDGLDGVFQGFGDGLQGHGRGGVCLVDHLAAGVGNVDETGADAGIALLTHVEYVVHNAVAHVGAGGEGEVAGQARVLHVLYHGLHGKGGEVGGRSVCLKGLV